MMVTKDLWEGALEHLDAIVSASGAAIGIIVWLVRLEGRISAQDKALEHEQSSQEQINTGIQGQIDGMRHAHSLLNETVVKAVTEVKESLARIEGFFKGRFGNDERLP